MIKKGNFVKVSRIDAERKHMQGTHLYVDKEMNTKEENEILEKFLKKQSKNVKLKSSKIKKKTIKQKTNNDKISNHNVKNLKLKIPKKQVNNKYIQQTYILPKKTESRSQSSSTIKSFLKDLNQIFDKKQIRKSSKDLNKDALSYGTNGSNKITEKNNINKISKSETSQKGQNISIFNEPNDSSMLNDRISAPDVFKRENIEKFDSQEITNLYCQQKAYRMPTVEELQEEFFGQQNLKCHHKDSCPNKDNIDINKSNMVLQIRKERVSDFIAKTIKSIEKSLIKKATTKKPLNKIIRKKVNLNI